MEGSSMTAGARPSFRVCALGALTLCIILVGCSTSRTGEAVGTKSTVTEQVTATPASPSTEQLCAAAPAVLSGGVFPERSSNANIRDFYAHVDPQPKSTNYTGCTQGLSYAVVTGSNGTKDQPGGTGSSMFEALVVFVHGEASRAVTPYVMHSVTIESASAQKIVARFDSRYNGNHPAENTTVTITLDGDDASVLPGLSNTYGDRLYIDLASAPTNSGTAKGPHGDDTTYSLRPSTDFTGGGGATYSFATPSGNINCFVNSDSLLCETRFSVTLGSDRTCHIPAFEGHENSADIFGWVNYDKPACGSVIQGNYRDGRAVLQYGEAVAFQPRSNLKIVCYSRNVGIACENPEGYGFSLAREGFTFYHV